MSIFSNIGNALSGAVGSAIGSAPSPKKRSFSQIIGNPMPKTLKSRVVENQGAFKNHEIRYIRKNSEYLFSKNFSDDENLYENKKEIEKVKKAYEIGRKFGKDEYSKYKNG